MWICLAKRLTLIWYAEKNDTAWTNNLGVNCVYEAFPPAIKNNIVETLETTAPDIDSLSKVLTPNQNWSSSICLFFGKLVGLFFSVTFRIVMQAPDAKAQYAEGQGKASPWILPPNRKNVPTTIIKTDESTSSDRSRTPADNNLTAVVSMRVSIGSSNLNHRSLLHDLEVDVSLQTQQAKVQVCEQFCEDIKKSDQVSLCDWSQRPWYRRFFGRLVLYVKYVF